VRPSGATISTVTGWKLPASALPDKHTAPTARARHADDMGILLFTQFCVPDV
jgi:hypothetical protein